MTSPLYTGESGPLPKGVATKTIGQVLEDLVDLVLQTMRTEGTVVEDYALADKSNLPDFWVLTKDGREWLMECKNIKKQVYDAGYKYSRVEHVMKRYVNNNIEWLQNPDWVNRFILDKDWECKKFRTRGTSGHPSKLEITVKDASPILVVSHVDIFDPIALELILDFFHKNIVVAGRQVQWGKGIDQPFSSVLNRLIQIFNSKEDDES